MSRILVAEDEARLASFLEKGLRASGFVTTVVGDGASASALARDEDFDLLILDLGLPGKDGLDVLRDLRDAGQRLPVIVLTARGDPHDRVEGLETRRRRLPRQAVSLRGARRADPGPAARRPGRSARRTQLRVGDVALDLRTRWASVGGETVELSAREFELLRTFLQHPNQVLCREQLLARSGATTTTRARTSSTSTSATCAGSSAQTRFETVRGVGYRFRRRLARAGRSRRSKARMPSGPSSVQSKKRGLTQS